MHKIIITQKMVPVIYSIAVKCYQKHGSTRWCSNVVVKQDEEQTQTDKKKDYLHKELKSLGIRPKQNNDLNGAEDLEYFADAVKQSMYQDYKIAYSKDGDKYKEEARSTVHVWQIFRISSAVCRAIEQAGG